MVFILLNGALFISSLPFTHLAYNWSATYLMYRLYTLILYPFLVTNWQFVGMKCLICLSYKVAKTGCIFLSHRLH